MLCLAALMTLATSGTRGRCSFNSNPLFTSSSYSYGPLSSKQDSLRNTERIDRNRHLRREIPAKS